MQRLRRSADEVRRCVGLIVSTITRDPRCGSIMVGCRVHVPLLVIGRAVVLIFTGPGMAVSNKKERSRCNNRRNNELPSQEAPEAPLPLGYSR
jgi:hypothetical protein